MIEPAERLVAESTKSVREVTRTVYDHLTALGCQPYVKTIYIGFEHEGQMVAALYPHQKRVEVALALPENHPHPLLIDATHLTWRTMPVAAVIRTARDGREAMALVGAAFARVSTGSHDVDLPNDHFARRRR